MKLTMDTGKPKFRFDGFGGNYCWNNASPAANYTIDNLKVAWGRSGGEEGDPSGMTAR